MRRKPAVWKRPSALTPGAFEAKRRGCTCDAIRNHYGRGHDGSATPFFIIEPACPLHGGDR